MPQVGASPGQIATVIAVQGVGAVLVGAVGAWWVGGVGLIGPAGAIFLGGFGAFWGLGAQREGWPQRSAILAVAQASALAFWCLGLGAYGALACWMPTQVPLSAAQVVLFAPLVALLPGIAALGLTLCAGDAAATALGSYDAVRLSRPLPSPQERAPGEWVDESGEPVDLYERFSARTLSQKPRPRR